MDNLLQKVGID